MLPRRTLSVLAVVSLAMLGSSVASAIPSPANSTVDECIRVCPAGDINFHVVVRDPANNPVAGSTVVVDFVNCFGLVICPQLGSEPYTFVAPASILMTTNAAGVVDIPLRAGGVCVAAVNIFADGVLLAQRGAVSSPDQNGDAVVNATDQAIMAVKLGGPYDPTADLNCSGALEIGDPNVLNAHLAHSCGAVVPTVPRSWGTVKIMYR